MSDSTNKVPMEEMVKMRLSALQESRDCFPSLTHRQRLELLQSQDKELWNGVEFKKFKKLIHKDNQRLRQEQEKLRKEQAILGSRKRNPIGMDAKVPIKPYPGCPYPCQLCGTPLETGGTEDNIRWCRPNGRYENKSLQWALDSDLYELTYQGDEVSTLVICNDCEVPQPWGDGYPITTDSTKVDYYNGCDEESDEEYPDYGDDYGPFGFTEDDAYELLCQGVKPWDDDAGAVLAALNGYY